MDGAGDANPAQMTRAREYDRPKYGTKIWLEIAFVALQGFFWESQVMPQKVTKRRKESQSKKKQQTQTFVGVK